MDRVSFGGFKNCVRLANKRFEVVLSTDVGPRILRYSGLDRENCLGEFPENRLDTELGEWRPYGGHRLWAAPEALPFSYAPDNGVIESRVEGNFQVRLLQPVDASGLEKHMAVTLDPETSEVAIRHRMYNRTSQALEIAPWALTVFKGGSAIVPLEPFRSHDDALLPSQPLVLWPFTNLSDPRISLDQTRLRVSCTADEAPSKLGVGNKRGWAAYFKSGMLFVKRFPFDSGATYPDYGANNEVYVAGSYMEIESLGPLVRLQPNESTDHWERWALELDVKEDAVEETLTRPGS